MLSFCDFIQVYVFSTNHHLKITCTFSIADEADNNSYRTVSY